MRNIENDYKTRIDNFSSGVIVSNLELFLNYCKRFYNRQFLTRKTANTDLISKFETLLSKHFESTTASGLPTVNSLAEEMNLSASYLSDMLRTITGQNTQQYSRKIDRESEDLLTRTQLSVSEIAFQLGFEYPQSFNKLFKSKTDLSPLAFRTLFN